LDQDTLSTHRPPNSSTPSLFVLTAQSNVTNTKNPLSLVKHAASLGYCTVLDAAALAPTSVMSLTDNPVDAMAISFYKMFGFPTGVGALIAKESFLQQLKRPWFAGGTVDVVQAPGNVFTMTDHIHERFEVSSLSRAAHCILFPSRNDITPYIFRPALPDLETISQWFHIRHHASVNYLADS
jgi:molybdenum cofactor sulfurtransferase